jgi:hypothetical protein
MKPSARHLARHYAEMLVAMLLGMAVLGLPAYAALGAMGISSTELHEDAPALMLLVMATTMTVPMVGWMAYRGHGLRASLEMSAAMFVPTFGVIALLAASLVEGLGTLLVIEHAAMLAAMLGAMLLRRDEYSHGVLAGHDAPRQVTA